VALPAPEPLNIDEFWRRFVRLVGRLSREKAHADVVLVIRDGSIKFIRVDRSLMPGALPPAE
jgi:hypothetical protein